MDAVDNNQFEVKPDSKIKRKFSPNCNVYLNPALDLLANDDPMCNNAMEFVPNKRRKRTRSCDITTFENTALDLGISRAAVNEFLMRELDNVRKNVRNYSDVNKRMSVSHETLNNQNSEPIYANLNSRDPCLALERESITEREHSGIHIAKPIRSDVDMDTDTSIMEQKPLNCIIPFDTELSAIEPDNETDNSVHIINKKSITKQILVNNQTNLSLSFIDRLGLDSPTVSNQSLYLDDDLNESNIMEIKTITIITKKKRLPEKKNTNPFLNGSFENITTSTIAPQDNPFLCPNETQNMMEMEYNEEFMDQAKTEVATNAILPRRLFTGDTNSTMSTVNDSVSNTNQNEYVNIDSMRADSPIYENIDEVVTVESKQSKILGHDVSQFNATDIMNLNKMNTQVNSSNESNDSKKDFKHQLSKATKLSKKVLKKIKQKFKPEKHDTNVTLNPYEVPRKPPKQKSKPNDNGIENPGLNLDNSDEIKMDEIDDDEEHQYETIKTLRNTQLNMNVTPLKEKIIDNFDSSHNRVNTPGKKVRFDSTLNQEKIITGNSFEYDVQSPGFDAKIDKYHDELENCINERKFLQQNM